MRNFLILLIVILIEGMFIGQTLAFNAIGEAKTLGQNESTNLTTNTMSHKHVQLEVDNQLIIDNQKITFVIMINDCIIFSNSNQGIPSASRSVNQWVYNGVNTLKVNFSVNPQFTEELKGQSFKIFVKQFEGASESMTETVVSELQWQYTPDTHFPVNLSQEFTLDIPYGNWSWRVADILNEETVPVSSLKSFVTSLHTALVNKNYAALEPFLKTKSTEMAQAFEIPLNERLDQQKDFFKNDMFTQPTWGLEPLTFDNLVFQFHAQGRLVEVADKEGNSLIQSTSLEDGYKFSLPLFLCYKNGQWILCR